MGQAVVVFSLQGVTFVVGAFHGRKAGTACVFLVCLPSILNVSSG